MINRMKNFPATLQPLPITLQPSGAINAANATAFQNELLATLSADSTTSLVIDMSQVDSLDSAGLIALVSALRKARSLDKSLALYAIPPAIRIMLELTQLDRAFNIVDDYLSQQAA